MSTARLIQSVENLTKALRNISPNLPPSVEACETPSDKQPIDPTNSNFNSRNENKLQNQKKFNSNLTVRSNTSQKKKLSSSLPLTHRPSVKQKLNYSPQSTSKSAKLHVIGIPLKYGENYNYSNLSVKEKAEDILEAVHSCIRKIQTQRNLEKQDTVIIQLREYAFEGSQNRYVTVEERNEILKILSQVFPVHFNLILGTGGIAYSIPVSESLDSHHKINRVRNNYKRIEQQYPQFAREGAHLQHEKEQMNEKLEQKSVTMILHNKNYLLTNQHHFNDVNNNKAYLSFSKLAPFRETERHRFSNSMIYNPGKNKRNLPFDPNVSIHSRTCAEIYYPELIEPSSRSSTPNLFLINSASCEVLPEIIDDIKKWYCYFFQIDSKKGCQYGLFNTNKLDSLFYINFYNYNISNSTLTMADQSPYCDSIVSSKRGCASNKHG